jgi:peptidoglycan-associated lipoprotein
MSLVPSGIRLAVAGVVVLGMAACAIAPVTVVSTASLPENKDVPLPAPVLMALALSPLDEDRSGKREDVAVLQTMEGAAIFFETDKSELSRDGKVKLLRVAEVLRRHRDVKVRIEGNADARGGRDYNYLLAEKRAQATKEFLVSADVRPDQVLIISYGAEKPLAPGQNEAHYELNRRSDIVPVDSRSK